MYLFENHFSGARDATQGKLLHKLIQTNDFRVVVVKDVETVELCGALKVRMTLIDEQTHKITKVQSNYKI